MTLGLERLWLKDESSRMGLPAFKILGASWAVINAVQQRLGIIAGDWSTIDDLAETGGTLRPMTLACATDGNHGRAVARMARWLGFEAMILVPDDMARARIEAIRSEGAEVRVIDGSYDDAVDASAALASDRCMVISDTAWPGYEDVPRWVIEGYSTILWEIDDALAELGEPGPDLVAVQIGVGALASAVVRHFRRPGVDPRPVIVGVEPTHAACMTASIEAGEPVQIPGPHDSIMSGLNCGCPLRWPGRSSRAESIYSWRSTTNGRGRRCGIWRRPGWSRASAARPVWPVCRRCGKWAVSGRTPGERWSSPAKAPPTPPPTTRLSNNRRSAGRLWPAPRYR